MGFLDGGDQQPHVEPPVTEVGVADHLVPGEGEQTGQRVADDGRSEMPDMHRLGDVGPGVVDHHVLRSRNDRESQLIITGGKPGPARQGNIRHSEVDEPRWGHLGPGDLVLGVEECDHLARDLSWEPSRDLGRAHRPVALELGQFGPLRGHHLAHLGREPQFREGRTGNFGEMGDQRHWAQTLGARIAPAGR